MRKTLSNWVFICLSSIEFALYTGTANHTKAFKAHLLRLWRGSCSAVFLSSKMSSQNPFRVSAFLLIGDSKDQMQCG